jgi:hypothetical protein
MPPPPPLTTQPAPAMEAASDANVSHKIIKPDIFESRPFVRIEQSSDSARVHSTRQQERREEQETRQYLHDLKERAQMDLDVQKQALAVKRFCRKKQWTYRLNLVSTYMQFLRISYLIYYYISSMTTYKFLIYHLVFSAD